MITESPDLRSEEALRDRHAGGRHLDPSRGDALRKAALQLIATIGYDRLTVDKIAACAGAGKATIYRRWSGKAELVADALMYEKASIPTPNTGTLRGDLAALAQSATEQDRQMDTQMMIGLVSALPQNADLREVFRERLVELHVATLTLIFERAVERGEIAPIENLDTIGSILPALVLHRLLIHGTAPDQEFIESVIEGVILPLLLVGSKVTLPIDTPLSQYYE